MHLEFIKILVEKINWHDALIFSLLSAGPTLLWLFICLRFDRQAPEPPRQILKIFFWGCFIVFPIMLITVPLANLADNNLVAHSILSILVLSFLVDGIFEELAKYLVLRFKTYNSPHFNELRDGFVYGMICGLGLAFVENILYGLVAGQLSVGITTVCVRGFTTTLLHFLTGGIIGYYLALAKFSATTNRSRRWAIWRGLILAILLHGLYNTGIRFGWFWSIVPAFLLLATVFKIIVYRIRNINGISI